MIIQILSSLAGFSIIAFIGWFSAKKNFIDDKITDGFTYIIIKIAVPAAIISSSAMELTSERASGTFTMLSCTIVFFFILICFGNVLGKLLPIDAQHKKALTLGITFGNVTFLGFPIAALLFGAEGIFYTAILNLSSNMFMYTYGIASYTASEGDGMKSRLKSVFLEPMTISTLVMLVLFFAQIKLPVFALNMLDTLGAISTPLSMITIGALISKIELRSAFTDWMSYVIAFIKMIVSPLLMLLALRLLNVDPIIASVCTILTAMPPAVMLAILANKYKLIPEFMTKTIVLCMILYMLTVPIIIFIIGKVYPGAFLTG